MKAIVVEQTGGPEQLKYVDLPVPEPGPKQVRVKIAAAGVNFIDVYFRTGLYKADPPIALGMEGAGTVDAVGPEVTEVAPGDRVAYTMARGSYAEYAIVPAAVLVKVPEHVDLETAAAVMLQGMTAHYLTRTTWPLREGQSCLVHAAAGGVGLLLVQMAKGLGAHVLGTAGSEEKAALARDAGADDVILYGTQDFAEEVKRLTNGRGVDVVYDSVGATTFMKSLDCLRPRGMMVTFGQSSGAIPPFDPLILNQKGSLFLTRPSLAHYTATRQELVWRAGEVLSAVASGNLKVRIHHTYQLAEAAQAHRDLEGRKTTGKVLLKP